MELKPQKETHENRYVNVMLLIFSREVLHTTREQENFLIQQKWDHN